MAGSSALLISAAMHLSFSGDLSAIYMSGFTDEEYRLYKIPEWRDRSFSSSCHIESIFVIVSFSFVIKIKAVKQFFFYCVSNESIKIALRKTNRITNSWVNRIA